MFASSLSQAFEAATPNACQSLLAQGIKFTVAVENQRGEWFLLHSKSQDHAGNLARHWVNVMGARGASCWRIFEDGIAHQPFALISPDYWDYEEE